MLSNDELESYCREYYSPIYRYCLFFLSNKEDAEDATQETFFIFSQKRQLLEERHISAWLYRTAHNIIMREYKKRYLKTNKEAPLTEKALEMSHKYVSFEADMISYYGPKHIKDIYDQLNDREKELFELCLDNRMKTAQMARILGIEPHACSMRKKRLRERCREIMENILFC